MVSIEQYISNIETRTALNNAKRYISYSISGSEKVSLLLAYFLLSFSSSFSPAV